MALLTKVGYGQVEPNHLSAQRTGQIYAQLPAHNSLDVVENGMFLYYDMVNGVVATTGSGEPMLVYNEIKLYDDSKKGYKYFALKKADVVDGKIYPRMFKTNIGDIITTNLVDVTSAAGSRKGKKFVPKNGVLTETDTPAAGNMVWICVAETTLPDGQVALKLQRIA